jgi:hypothetical protein
MKTKNAYRSRLTSSSTSDGGHITNTSRWPNDSPLLPTDLRPAYLRVSVSLLYSCSAFLASSRVCGLDDCLEVLNVIIRSTSGGRDSGIFRLYDK